MTTQFSQADFQAMSQPDFWRELNPELKISNFPFKETALFPSEADDRHARQMRDEGHFVMHQVLPEEAVSRLAKGIRRLTEAGFPPAFCYLYDDYWQVFKALQNHLVPIFGENYRCINNQWAWHIIPSSGLAGFTPHRDGQGVDYNFFPTGTPLSEDGQPFLATIWISLTDVSTLDSCMYLLPGNHDPNVDGHTVKDINDFNIPYESLQHVRGLPCKAGSVLSWNPNILHWGSSCSDYAQSDRISFATYLINAEMPNTNKSFSLDPGQPMSFRYRLGGLWQGLNHYKSYKGHDTFYSQELVDFCGQYVGSKIYDLST